MLSKKNAAAVAMNFKKSAAAAPPWTSLFD
jgi:hypothetical protein